MRLFEEWTFGSAHRSRNRIALAPLTNQQSYDDGRLSADELAWLQLRAEGGFGIVITCASHVMATGKGFRGQMGIFSDDLLPGLRQLAHVLNSAGALSVVQLYHGGVRSPESLTGVPAISAADLPSGKEYGGGARAATKAEIEAVIDAFVAAADRAYRAGFSGVELHGAHGYLLCQFIDRNENQRTDQWGGSVDNRARILLEIVRRIRAQLPRSFILGVRLSPESYLPHQGLYLEDSLAIAESLGRLGIDYLHLSLHDVLRKPSRGPDDGRTILERFAALPRNYALMVAGGLLQPERAEAALALGADLVALGRIAIGNAAWPRQAADSAWQPKLAPYQPAYLQSQGVGPAFMDYLRPRPGMVVS